MKNRKLAIKKYQYGNETAFAAPAAGVSGMLLKDIEGCYFFRIYHSDNTFTDYELRHDDLSVTINEDALANLYCLNGRNILDHSPEVLDLKDRE